MRAFRFRSRLSGFGNLANIPRRLDSFRWVPIKRHAVAFASLPAGFVVPCLPTRAPRPPCGAIWLHEIKHDGFRVIARKEGKRVRLYSRPGHDLTHRFPLIVQALGQLRARSCIIDGEAVSCGDDGIASFDRIRYRRHDADVFMWAFDLIDLDSAVPMNK